jgi:hypothetical protein
MSEVIETITKIYVRYFLLDDVGNEVDLKWLHGSRKYATSGPYDYRLFGGLHYDAMSNAYDWVDRYNGDVTKAVDMASRLAKIVKCGKKLLAEGWEWELVMVRDVTRRTVTTVTNNAMVFLAVAALD